MYAKDPIATLGMNYIINKSTKSIFPKQRFPEMKVKVKVKPLNPV